MRTPRALTLAVISLALFAGATACGSDGSDDASTTTTVAKSSTTTTEKAAEETTTTEGGDDPATTTTVADPDPDATDADKQAYVDALKGALGAGSDDIFDADQLDCLAEGFVDVLDVDALKGAGISPTELAGTNGTDFPKELGVDEEKANAMYDAYGACDVDLVETFKKVLGAGGDLTTEQSACVDDLLSDDALRESFVADVIGKDLADDPTDQIGQCLGLDTAEGPTANTVTVPAN